MFEFFPGNRGWSVQMLRLLAESYYGGGEFNEIFEASMHVRSSDVESWYNAWFGLAKKLESEAVQKSKVSPCTARKLYFRACNYYRNAEFMLKFDETRRLPTYSRSVECFREAAKLSGDIEAVEVPFEGKTMSGYFFKPWVSVSKYPALVVVGGADSTAEELYFFGPQEALERGMACLIVDGPGRGSSLRLKRMHSRYDYERPVSAMIDYVASRGDADPEKIGLVGVSMGGYYASRAAAFDKRVKACALLCACYDVLRDIYDFYPEIRGQLSWIVGAGTDTEAREMLKSFNLVEAARKIVAPFLIVHGEDDFVINVRSATRMYEDLQCPKELKIYGSGQRGSVHCQYDAHAEAYPYIYDWIHRRLSA